VHSALHLVEKTQTFVRQIGCKVAGNTEVALAF